MLIGFGYLYKFVIIFENNRFKKASWLKSCNIIIIIIIFFLLKIGSCLTASNKNLSRQRILQRK